MLYVMKDEWLDNKKCSPKLTIGAQPWNNFFNTSYMQFLALIRHQKKKFLFFFSNHFRIKPTCLVFQERQNIGSCYTTTQLNFENYKTRCGKFATLSYSDKVQENTVMYYYTYVAHMYIFLLKTLFTCF